HRIFYPRICECAENGQPADRQTNSTERPCMNRLLSLDGGGMRGFFTLEILGRVETLLRERYRKPDLVLADYFNFIGGTSTGAIIAGLLSWGRSIQEIKDL